MAIKNAQYNVKNQNGFDTYHFETSEEVIIGQIQSLGRSGFRVFPGGLMEVWGEAAINNSGYEAEVTVTLPTEVTKSIFDIHLTKHGNTNAVDLVVKSVSATTITIKAMALARSNGTSVGIGSVGIFYNFKTTV